MFSDFSRVPGPRPSIKQVKAFLTQTLRICANDGRVFIGTFVCMDKEKNIVLTNVEEYRIDQPAGGSLGVIGDGQGRYVTMVMVPWRMVVKIEIQSFAADGDVQQAQQGACPPLSEEDLYT